MSCPIRVTGIEILNRPPASIPVGSSWDVGHRLTPPNATNKAVSWHSSNVNVVTVGSTGNLLARNPGVATITVTALGGTNVSASYTVTVVAQTTPVTGISILNRPPATITVGSSWDVGHSLTPPNATNKTVNWSSSNNNIATVGTTGFLTAKNPGSATITATAAGGTNISASYTVTVVAATVPVTGISILNRPPAIITVGSSWDVGATVTPSNATNKAVSWHSSNTNAVTLGSTGNIFAKAPGTATITVTALGGTNVSASYTVTVVAATMPVTGVTISGCSGNLNIGQTRTLTANVSPSNATNKTVTWSSNNTAAVTVNSNGLVTAVGKGTARVTVTTNDGSKTASVTFTVN